MKEKVTSILILLVLMALLPFISVKCSNQNTLFTYSKKESGTSTKSTDDNELIYGLVAAKYKSEYSEDTIKAITIILNTNYKANSKLYDLENKTDFLNKDEFCNLFSKKEYGKIKSIVDSVNETTMLFNNKLKIIPFSETSNGKTITDKNYNYISAVASPWDCYFDTYNENNHCVGVSLSGINYLCKNGFTYKEALLWYLPQGTIND